jgi:hypothetical protein
VLFTILLFFGGLAATIKRFRIRVVFLTISILVLAADVLIVLQFPEA